MFHLDQRIYRARSKTIPPLPKSIKFEIPVAFSTTSSDENFLFFDHLYAKETKRILAFASPMQLKNLFSSKLICVDGTFSICPRQYKQLLIIHTINYQNYDGKRMRVRVFVFLFRNYVLLFNLVESFFSLFVFFRLFLATPVLYALLNDKKARTYKLLFQALKHKAKEMKMKFEPDRIISDFESGMVSTVKKQVGVLIYLMHFFLYFSSVSACKYNSSGLFIPFISRFNKENEKIWLVGLLQE